MTPRRALVPGLALAFLLALLPAAAGAQQPSPQMTLEVPVGAAVGERVAIRASLLDPAGSPIRGEVVTFHADMSFLNTRGTVKLGQAATDDSGTAVLAYTPRSEGELAVTARFAGNQVFAPAGPSAAMVVTSGEATYEQELPFRIPGFNVHLLAFLLTAVWSIYLGVAVLLLVVSRAGAARTEDGYEGEVEP